MKLDLTDLRTERRWRATTGMDQGRFEQLLTLFSQGYYQKYGQTVSQRQGELDVTASLQSEQELLLFTLFRLKSPIGNQ